MTEINKKQNRRKTAVFKPKKWFILPLLLCLFQSTTMSTYAAESVDISVSVDTTRNRKAISPYIYGINESEGNPIVSAFAVKQTGMELNTYNWEINAANSGADEGSVNIALSSGNNTPAEYPSAFLRNAAERAIPGRFLTLPMSGYAAADAAGPVSNNELDRFYPVLNMKNGEYLLNPDLTDKYVYTDEYLTYMINKFGWREAMLTDENGVKIGGITGYFLGSDPTAVREAFPALDLPQITAQTLANSCIDAARTVKMIDPSADVFAPSISGLEQFINLSNNTDWENYSNNYSWYIDYFLDAMSIAAEENPQTERLLDSLDLHFYTEAVTDYGVSVLTSSARAANTARMEAPRLLWDSTYAEASRSAVTYKAYTPLIPTLQASIRMYNPGTKLSFSEYAFGGGDNFSGGVAVADTLGIFGTTGIYMAGLVPSDVPDYEYSGLQIYTNYDGSGSKFGDISVEAVSDDNTSVYAATGENSDNRLTVLYINKTNIAKNAEFTFVSSSDYNNVRVYGFDSTSADITERTDGDLLVTDNIFEFEIPEMSVYMFEFTGTTRPGGIVTTAAQIPDIPNAVTTPVTDEYGATLTAITSEAEMVFTSVPPTETQAETTVYAPSKPPDMQSVPLVLKVAGTTLLVAVIAMMVYIIYRMLRH
jgi:hypothetical protein